VQDVLEDVIGRERWQGFFEGRDQQTYWFFDHAEYEPWLAEAGLTARRVELVPKRYGACGKRGAGGVVSDDVDAAYAESSSRTEGEVCAGGAEEYVRRHPADAQGNVHVEMVRLEVEAVK
jgi:hypothetical protein